MQKSLIRFLINLNIDLPYDPAIPLIVMYPKECNSGYSKGSCTPMFIAALFPIAKMPHSQLMDCVFIHNGILFNH
jgi:hypothetical protein